MVLFFIKHKKIRGAITVFMTIVYLSVYLLIGIFVDGGRVRMAGTIVEDVQQIATENVMSQYNRGLYEYYGLFGISNYEVDQIVKDVKSQIEESLGLKVSEDSVKELMLDTVNGVNAAISNAGILSSDGSVIDNIGDYAKKIQSEISDSKKRFNPYGVTVKDASANYIDLTNQDALRAQIKDDMRYEALMIPTMGFFSNVNKLLEVAGGVDTIIDITSKTGQESEVKFNYNEYKNKLNSFSKELQQLISETYKVKWKQIDTLKYKTEEKKPEAKSWFDNLSAWWLGSKSSSIETIKEESNHYDIQTSFSTENITDEDQTGLKTSLQKNELYDFCKNYFDNVGGYPSDEHEYPPTDEDDDEEPECIVSDHRVKIESRAKEIAEDYRLKTFGNRNSDNSGELRLIIVRAKGKINESITVMDNYLRSLSNLIADFNKKIDRTSNDHVEDKESTSIYSRYIESYLKQWNDVASQKKIISDISNKLSELIDDSFYNQFEKEIDEAIKEVTDSFDDSDAWEPKDVLYDVINSYSDRSSVSIFHKKMLDLVDLLNKYQGQATGTTQKKHVFQLLKEVSKAVAKERDEGKNSLFAGLSGFKYSEHSATENAKIFDYAEYLSSKKDDKDTSSLIEFADEDFDFTGDDLEDKIEDKVNGFFNKVKNVISNLTNNMIDNIYDETYILTHCRDYVHTYKYKINEEELKDDKNVDAIFNKKFVEDQSETKYLSDSQFDQIKETPAEIEYIIFGGDDKFNVGMMYTTIFAIRLALNLIAVYTSPAATEAAALNAIPFVGWAVALAAPVVCALSQTVLDMKTIMSCKKGNLYNGGSNLHLITPVVQIANEAINSLVNTLDEEAGKISKTSTKELLTEVEKNNIDRDTTIDDAVRLLRQVIDEGTYDPYVAEKVVTDEAKNIIAGSAIEAVTNDNKPKAGYTFYLLVYLFINGMDKDTQMNRLQNIIEANMKKAQSDFLLNKTYSQISVETNLTVKYLFMTQSFMKKTFSSTNNKIYDSFPMKIKTAFAY